ncbi:MBG domain-containing protein, partial [Chitinivibrio alkaliphilus]|uniref:MBG domain-containing protein n=1 Tax=Chitinivibrio alkaliphilus TaxID=1505232 RepID=UPI0005529CAC
GNLIVTTRPLEITVDDTSKVYGDLYEFDNEEYSISSGDLVSGHTLSLALSSDGAAEAAETGSYDIAIGSVEIMDGGQDVTSNY